MLYYCDYDEPVFRPPAEANSLIIQATIGCSQNSCRFCGMYKMKRFRIRPVQDIFHELECIPIQQRHWVQRIFLADGDALVYPQDGLITILDALAVHFPNLKRIGVYASPKSLQSKSKKELALLREKKLRTLYVGLESGDDMTLANINKGFSADEMMRLCLRAHQEGFRLSITAILGLAGHERSHEHASATAEWVTEVSPKYFSLLTLIRGGNDHFLSTISPLSNGKVIEEALQLVQQLNPTGTILRSNHVSNVLLLSGRYPKDRKTIIEQAEKALGDAKKDLQWFESMEETNNNFL